jgi:hypothetical protein
MNSCSTELFVSSTRTPPISKSSNLQRETIMSETLIAGQSAAQVSGTGAVISIGGPTGASGTETFTAIGAVSNFKNTGRKRAVTSTTNFGSLGIAQKLGTILDLGQATFTVFRISNDPGQMAVIAANLSPAAYDFELQMPVNPLIGQTTTGDLIKFSGIVTEAGDFDVDISKASEFTVTVDVIAYTVTAGS